MRPTEPMITGSATELAGALDWSRPPRQMIGTAFWYLATDQWRYDALGADELMHPLGPGRLWGAAMADCIARSARMGWMPSYPTFDRTPDFRVALPLHPEFRTMPMVWYIPPLSPVVDKLVETGHDGEDVGNIFGAIDALRIPVEYLAELFTAGDVQPVTASLRKLGAMRSYMRDINLGRPPNPAIPDAAGLNVEQIQRMYRLLALAKYEERYVIPQAHAELAEQLDEPGCSLDYEGGPETGGVAYSTVGATRGRTMQVSDLRGGIDVDGGRSPRRQ